MKTIDVTPTWRGLLPAMLYGARNATTMEARKVMRDELLRMVNMSLVMSEADLMELIEAHFTSASDEVRKAAKKRLEALADAADVCVAQASPHADDDEPYEPDDAGETYLPRDEGAPPRAI